MSARSRPSRSSHTNRKKATGKGRKISTWIVVVLLAALLIPAIFSIWQYMLRADRPVFSGSAAYNHIVKQVSFGPRISGTEAHSRTQQFLLETLQPLADKVGVQTFTYRHPRDSTKVFEGANIVASFNMNPASGKRILLMAHWDTRPIADQDPDPARRTQPVTGANDGASGVGVLLEIARLLKEERPQVGVDILLTDMEDMGEDGFDTSKTAIPYSVGAAEFVRANAGYRPEYGILLDMVCDKNLRIPREANSMALARPVVDRVWKAADKVGARAFVDEPGGAVYDDHIPFLQAGVRVINLIHWPFPSYWHTTRDVPEQCSAASLQQVGDVLIEVIYSE